MWLSIRLHSVRLQLQWWAIWFFLQLYIWNVDILPYMQILMNAILEQVDALRSAWIQMEPSYACVILDISFHLTIRPALVSIKWSISAFQYSKNNTVTNECASSNEQVRCQELCIPTNGSFRCDCQSGYSPSGYNCSGMNTFMRLYQCCSNKSSALYI